MRHAALWRTSRHVFLFSRRAPICLTGRPVHRSATEQMPQQGFVPLRCVVERLNVFQRDHQHMSGRLRVDVANDDAAIVLMDKLCGNVAGYYFAEEAVVVGHDLVYRIAISYPRISSTLTESPPTVADFTTSPHLNFRQFRYLP